MKRVFLLILLIVFPILVNAKTGNSIEENYKVVSVNEKYYKTIYNNINTMTYNTTIPITIEISKEEYEAVDKQLSINPLGAENTGETEYKKLTSSILEDSSKYIYKAVLEWKKMPATRSYDILAIGFNPNVKATNVSYKTYYCLKNGSCSENNIYYVKRFSSGVGVSFKLPESSDVIVLKNTLTLNMDKNVNGVTIKTQRAVADYSHATKTIPYDLSHSYNVNVQGIDLNNDSLPYYDNIVPVQAVLNCNW